jgi:hypothetical protein
MLPLRIGATLDCAEAVKAAGSRGMNDGSTSAEHEFCQDCISVAGAPVSFS